MTVDLAGDGADKRAYRLGRIRNLIVESGGVHIASVLGFCEVNLGLTEKRARAYVETLRRYGIIYIRKDKLYAKK